MAASGSRGRTAEVRALGRGEAIARAAETPMIMLNAPLVGQRLGYPELSGLDLLELFAFVHPARFAVPTPKGLADALGLAVPADDDRAPRPSCSTRRAALLATLARRLARAGGRLGSAQALARLAGPGRRRVAGRLTRPERDERWLFSRLPEWEESGGRAAAAPGPARRRTTRSTG